MGGDPNVNSPMRIVNRLGTALMLMAFLCVLVAFGLGGSPGFLVIIAGHVMLYVGFVMCLVTDRLLGRTFSIPALLYLLLMAVVFFASGPVVRANGY